MAEVYIKNIPVSICMQDGEKIEPGKKMSGVAVLGKDEKEFTFSKNAKREKTYSRNPALFSGDHTTARLQKDGGYRLTTMISSAFDLSKEKNIGILVDEFRTALMKIKN